MRKKVTYLFLFIFLTLLIICNHRVTRFKPNLHLAIQDVYEPYFHKEDIIRLKTEWKELYLYLKKGHILKNKSSIDYIYSYKFHRFKNTPLYK